jgi:ubiquinone/menaquinone biosynthesis C-methylase UbiE
MPFSNNLFNKVFVLTVLQNSPDPAKTLTEIKRVGKTGTFFVVTGLKKIFSKRAFTRLLNNARLKAVAFEEKDLKCYVAVCTDRSHSAH